MQYLVLLLLVLLLSPAKLVYASNDTSCLVKQIMNLKVICKENRAIQLADIYVPPKYRNKAEKLLRTRLLDKNVLVTLGKGKFNRYQEYIAHIHDERGRSVQEELLKNGFAYVYIVDDSELLVNELYNAEKVAIASHAGIWKRKVLTSLEIKDKTYALKNKFVVIEGKIHNVYEGRKNTYINFEEDWQTDFSISIEKQDTQKFEELDFNTLIGKNIRVRGFLESYNGPFIKVSHKGQLQVLP